MWVFLVMENKKFELGKLIVLERFPVIKIPKPHWKEKFQYKYTAKYLCFCGKEFVSDINWVQCKKTKSCGCYRDYLKNGGARYIDGRNDKRLYQIYLGIVKRLTNPKNIGYKNYGGRGITLFPEWNDYAIFEKWSIENGYTEELSIDRKDVNGNYEPSNCRWITQQEQNFNRRK